MDRFGIIIERQEQLEALIKEVGFLPFFKNGILGFSIEEMTPPEAMYPDLYPLKDRVEGRTPKQSRGRIIDHLQALFPDVERKKIEKLI